MLFACLSAFLGLVFGTLDVSGKPFRAGGYAGEFLAGELSEYLNRTGSVIVVLTLIVLSVIMSTQFSFGRFFAALIEGARRRREPRPRRLPRLARRAAPREAAPRGDRQAHEERAPPSPRPGARPAPTRGEGRRRRSSRPRGEAAREPPPRRRRPERRARSRAPSRGRRTRRSRRRLPLPPPPPPPARRSRSRRPSRRRWSRRRCRCPIPEPMSKAPAERRKGEYALPPVSLLDASRPSARSTSAS